MALGISQKALLIVMGENWFQDRKITVLEGLARMASWYLVLKNSGVYYENTEDKFVLDISELSELKRYQIRNN